MESRQLFVDAPSTPACRSSTASSRQRWLGWSHDDKLTSEAGTRSPDSIMTKSMDHGFAPARLPARSLRSLPSGRTSTTEPERWRPFGSPRSFRNESRLCALQDPEVKRAVDDGRPVFEKARLSVTSSTTVKPRKRASRKLPPLAATAFPDLEAEALCWSAPRQEWYRPKPLTASHEVDVTINAAELLQRRPRLKRDVVLQRSRSEQLVAIDEHRLRARETGGTHRDAHADVSLPTTNSWVAQRASIPEPRRHNPVAITGWSTRFTCGLPLQAGRGSTAAGGHARWPAAALEYSPQPPHGRTAQGRLADLDYPESMLGGAGLRADMRSASTGSLW